MTNIKFAPVKRAFRRKCSKLVGNNFKLIGSVKQYKMKLHVGFLCWLVLLLGGTFHNYVQCRPATGTGGTETTSTNGGSGATGMLNSFRKYVYVFTMYASIWHYQVIRSNTDRNNIVIYRVKRTINWIFNSTASIIWKEKSNYLLKKPYMYVHISSSIFFRKYSRTMVSECGKLGRLIGRIDEAKHRDRITIIWKVD